MPCGALVLRLAQNVAPKTGYPQEKWGYGPRGHWRLRQAPACNRLEVSGKGQPRPCVQHWYLQGVCYVDSGSWGSDFVTGLWHLLFFHSIISDSLRPHRLQHTRLPCPSLSPRVCLNSCLLSLWCHPTISSSVVLFSSCSQSFPASGSFPMTLLFTSGGQSIGVSASASVLPMNIQDYFPLGLTGWISLQSTGLSRVFSSTIVWKHQIFSVQLSLWSNSHIHTWLLEKP